MRKSRQVNHKFTLYFDFFHLFRLSLTYSKVGHAKNTPLKGKRFESLEEALS